MLQNSVWIFKRMMSSHNENNKFSPFVFHLVVSKDKASSSLGSVT